MSGLDAPQASTPPLRSRLFPRSRRSLKSPSPEPLQTLAAPLRRSCLLRRPDPPVRMLWPWWFYSWLVACSRGTVIPRISVVPPVACRGLRPCPHYYLCLLPATAVAVAEISPKQQWPTKLTHAAPTVPARSASPARMWSRLCIYAREGRRLPPPGLLRLRMSRKFAIFVLLARKSCQLSAIGLLTSEIYLR